MTILLQMKTRQVELVVGLDLLRKQGSLSRVWDRTDFIILMFPNHQVLTIQRLDSESQIIP